MATFKIPAKQQKSVSCFRQSRRHRPRPAPHLHEHDFASTLAFNLPRARFHVRHRSIDELGEKRPAPRVVHRVVPIARSQGFPRALQLQIQRLIAVQSFSLFDRFVRSHRRSVVSLRSTRRVAQVASTSRSTRASRVHADPIGWIPIRPIASGSSDDSSRGCESRRRGVVGGP